MLRRLVVAALGVVTVGALLAVPGGCALPAASVVHVTAAGDYAALSTTSRVLNAVKAARPDAHFALGDLSYGTAGEERAWCDFVTARVGAGFPFELLAGNHESDGINGNIDGFAACLPNELPGLVGTYARQYYVDYPQDDPTVRFVMISPGLTFPDGLWDYSAGSARYQWTASAIDGARAAGIPWVVVGMHKPCLSIGGTSCESGRAVNDLLLQKKVDLVLSGHRHSYQRTKQLTLRAGCSNLAIDTYDADCVVDADDILTGGAGTVYVTAGTGGVNLGKVELDDVERPYFAAASGSDSDPSFGYLDLVADADTLTGRFVPVTGAFHDAFTISRGTTATTTTAATTTAATTTAATSALAADAFSRTLAAGWGTAETGGAWTVGPMAQGAVSGGTGLLRMPAAGAGAGAYLAGASSSNTDLTATLSVDKPATGSGTYVWLRGRRVPGAGDYRAKLWWRPGNTVRVSLSRSDSAGVETAIGGSVMLAGGVTPGEQVRVRLQVTGTAPSTIKAKVWPASQSEPTAWTVSATDATASLQTAGYVGVMAYLSASATDAPVTVAVDDWHATIP
jgi:3',5'-cyclic AMP phosphodiesterase CpdA